MKQLLSAAVVKRSLSGHSWLGLLLGVFMYLICLSGTVAVLYTDLERWEQPDVPEFVAYSPSILDKAYAELLAQGTEVTHHMYLNMPTEDMPRATLSTQQEGWFINPDGTLGPQIEHDFTHVLIRLHNYLHMPASFGMIVVSIMGALLCGLIVSGFLSHPSIFRDAFSFRRQGSKRLEQVDLHNRLSVWGTPFHLMIAVTGAWFGLAGLFTWVVAAADFDGDVDAVLSAVYGAEPQLHQEELQVPAIGRAVQTLQTEFPDNPAFFLTVEDADIPETQYMVAGTRHYDRLIWGELHTFDAAGNYLSKTGYSDGETGRQAIYSVYRLHFGSFAGWLTKAAYILFGAALTVVSASGINIWLARRKTRDYLNNLWTGVVWGAPASLALNALADIVLGLASPALFWVGMIAAMAFAQVKNAEETVKANLQGITGILLCMVLVAHIWRFGAAALGPAALIINVLLLITAVAFLWRALAFRHAHESGHGIPAASEAT